MREEVSSVHLVAIGVHTQAVPGSHRAPPAEPLGPQERPRTVPTTPPTVGPSILLVGLSFTWSTVTVLVEMKRMHLAQGGMAKHTPARGG